MSQKGTTYVALTELNQKLSTVTKVDRKNGQVRLSQGETSASFVRDVTVVEINGLYYPMKQPLLFTSKEIYVPVDTLQKIFGKSTVVNGSVELVLTPTKQPSAVQTAGHNLSADQLISYLGFLRNPIKGAHVSTRDSSLPGAPRTYRKGVHEGIDWYGGQTTGVPVTKKTPILSMADGVVVRADHGYQEMTTPQRQKLLALGKQNNGQTPQFVLDKLRGRSVWVQHKHGVMARYVHLDRIGSNVKVGQKVKTGELIGYVGNSGTSDGAKGNNIGLHLHLDLFVYGKWPWERFTIKERRKILENVFPANG